MAGDWNTLSLWSHALVALTYTALAAHVWRPTFGPAAVHQRAARAFAMAIGLTAIWGWSGFVSCITNAFWADVIGRVADSLRYGAWFAFLLFLLRPPGSNAELGADARWLNYVSGGLVLTAVVSQLYVMDLVTLPLVLARAPAFIWMANTVLGLFLLEQLFRNVQEDSRWNAKPLCLALAGLFIFDFYAFSIAALFNTIDPDSAKVRGVVHSLMSLLLVFSTTRRADWIAKLRISRKLAFHSASLLAAGIYLLLISFVGYYVRYFGGGWGQPLQLALFFAALVALAVIGFSGTARAKLRVTLGKHFLRYQYDYREEWLKFTQSLSAQESPEAMGHKVLQGLANLVESPSGALWLENGTAPQYSMTTNWNLPAFKADELPESSLIKFLKSTRWVVNLDEYRNTPSRYGQLILPTWLVGVPSAWLIIPLLIGDKLIGFVLLVQPRTKFEVNWEVTDLLKVAARQAASFLYQMQATEALLEARKFDAFNKMSAFVVHDLKNIIAQLSLMLKNAQRLQDNPEFREDMLLTVQNSLDRMRQMILQLKDGTPASGGSAGIDTHALAKRIAAGAAARGLPLNLDLREPAVARGDEQRLERIVGHLVQNGFDASLAGSPVSLTVGRSGSSAHIVVGDNGQGMTQEFIHNHLFRPFKTTKADGMGIGAFESFQYVQELGGEINVDSKPNSGTVVTLLLPLLHSRIGSDLQMLKAQ